MRDSSGRNSAKPSRQVAGWPPHLKARQRHLPMGQRDPIRLGQLPTRSRRPRATRRRADRHTTAVRLLVDPRSRSLSASCVQLAGGGTTWEAMPKAGDDLVAGRSQQADRRRKDKHPRHAPPTSCRAQGLADGPVTACQSTLPIDPPRLLPCLRFVEPKSPEPVGTQGLPRGGPLCPGPALGCPLRRSRAKGAVAVEDEQRKTVMLRHIYTLSVTHRTALLCEEQARPFAAVWVVHG